MGLVTSTLNHLNGGGRAARSEAEPQPLYVSDSFGAARRQLRAASASQLTVVTDFDRTLTASDSLECACCAVDQSDDDGDDGAALTSHHARAHHRHDRRHRTNGVLPPPPLPPASAMI
jgi:hypothetical protein